MTSTNTLPVPRLAPPRTTHEHAWLVESRHPTSEGTVLYVRCDDCGTRRVDLQSHAQTPPAALSPEFPRRSS
ncbi:MULTISPECIES: hypothetical protein [unclassified Microbacterium]|uniref:hypothetical protein n=1 Tax=unclassified Microbacterium TaxID=2609290 RepID=UPI000EA928E5|nr:MULTISPECIES: hypothetical protein [unclassified Microbacterium]MBT2483212.1 hypothetical protein [Microbacterium sp. ISL-108]RKN66263.1 hypothetical protein D7252_00695 [Microbacterium sp. CGR2]